VLVELVRGCEVEHPVSVQVAEGHRDGAMAERRSWWPAKGALTQPSNTETALESGLELVEVRLAVAIQVPIASARGARDGEASRSSDAASAVCRAAPRWRFEKESAVAGRAFHRRSVADGQRCGASSMRRSRPSRDACAGTHKARPNWRWSSRGQVELPSLLKIADHPETG